MRGSWKKGQFISLGNSKWWKDARSYLHFWKAGALHKPTFTPFRECFQYLLHTKLFTFTQITFFLCKLHSSTQISYRLRFQKKTPFEEGTLDKWKVLDCDIDPSSKSRMRWSSPQISFTTISCSVRGKLNFMSIRYVASIRFYGAANGCEDNLTLF